MAPQPLVIERNLYGGEIVVQLRSSMGDLLPCQKDNGNFRVRVRDTETGLLLCNDSITTRDFQQRRIILTYNFTQNSGSQVIEVLRDERLLTSHTVVLDTRPTPSFSLYVSLSFPHFQLQSPCIPRGQHTSGSSTNGSSRYCHDN